MESLVDSQVSRGLVETAHNVRWEDIPEDQEASPVEVLHLLLTDINVRWWSVGRPGVFCSAGQ